jgi:hypothetical protein
MRLTSGLRTRLVTALICGIAFGGLVGADSCGTETKSEPDSQADTNSAQDTTTEDTATQDTATQDTATEDTTTEEPAAPPKPKIAKVGDAITLAGQDEGSEMKVTLTAVLDPLPVGEFDSPASGKRFVGIVIRMTNTGTANYSDSPSNGADIIYGADEQADGTIVSEGPCGGGFSSQTRIAPGDSRKGCLPFEVGANNKLKQFQFTLDSGFADETGKWSLRGS